MATSVKGVKEQVSYVNSPVFMAFAPQMAGQKEVTTYLIDFTVLPLVPSATNHLIDFNVVTVSRSSHTINFNIISGEADEYLVDFNVLETIYHSGTVGFDVVKAESYPIDFNVQETKYNRYAVNFDVVAKSTSPKLVSYDILYRPIKYFIDFNIQQLVRRSHRVISYVTKRRTNTSIKSQFVPHPSGAATRARNNSVVFRVYMDNQLIGGNRGRVPTTSGTGIYCDIIGIPEVSGTMMKVTSYVNGRLTNTWSGTYQPHIGVKML